MTREMRDHIRQPQHNSEDKIILIYICRSRLGPDLVFVVLSMDKGEIRKRVKARHHGEEQAVEMMEVNKSKEH